ncbi:MAG TPA: hypothetical protein VFB13_05305 [Reyranella sp.]|nr:hypothetical protein [Reyranella sp.]
MSRQRRSIDVARAAMAVALLIERRTGKPCPTLDELVDYTTLPHRRVWWFIERLRERGLIDVEERGTHVQRQRRMRVFCGDWTDWTERRPRRDRPPESCEGEEASDDGHA